MQATPQDAPVGYPRHRLPPAPHSDPDVTSNAEWATAEVVFDYDYDRVIGGRPALFLAECSAAVSPGACAAVRRGNDTGTPSPSAVQ